MQINSALLSAIHRTAEGICLTDPHLPDNPLVYVNDAFCALTGYQKHEAMGKNCRFLQGEESNPETIRAISATVQKQQDGVFELLNYRKNGEKFWNRLILTPVFEQGKLRYFAGFQSDITNIKQNLAKMNENQDEMLKTISELNQRMLKAAVSLRQEQATSHEIRTAASQLTHDMLIISTILENNSADILKFVNSPG